VLATAATKEDERRFLFRPGGGGGGCERGIRTYVYTRRSAAAQAAWLRLQETAAAAATATDGHAIHRELSLAVLQKRRRWRCWS
jgi:hypothetical protein